MVEDGTAEYSGVKVTPEMYMKLVNERHLLNDHDIGLGGTAGRRFISRFGTRSVSPTGIGKSLASKGYRRLCGTPGRDHGRQAGAMDLRYVGREPGEAIRSSGLRMEEFFSAIS